MKNVNKIIFLLLFSLFCSSFHAHADSNPKQLLLEASRLMDAYKDHDALEKYRHILVVSPENYEALWRSSLLHSRIGQRYSDETARFEHFTEAKKFAEIALCVKPDDSESNYVMALAMSNLALVSGVKERIAAAVDVKKYIDAALAVNPEHAGAWHLLGRWNFKVANFNIAETAATNLLFGGVPEGASNENAVQAMERAIQFNPNNILYYYDLARIYRQLKSKDECANLLQLALQLDLQTTDDLEISRKCKSLLKEIGRN